jgi:cytidyltransferase-like protein
MSSRIAVVPGSFDPPTLGHLDVIRRAAALYDQLHVLVVHNPGKEAMLPIAQRQALLEQSIAESDGKLRTLKCEYVQSFMYAPPLAAEEARRLLQDRQNASGTLTRAS